MEAVWFALAAGVVASVNPCGFALLPAYLSLFVLGEADAPPGRGVAVLRAVVATGAMTTGFLAVFGTFGLVLAPAASMLQRWLPVVTVGLGLALAGFGALLLVGRSIAPRVRFLRLTNNPVASTRSMFLYGVAYAVASLGCTIAPFLAVTATTFTSGDPLTGVAAYAAYALGMGLLVGVLAVAAALGTRVLAARLRAAWQLLSRATGLVLVVAGLYVAWYGGYELRLHRGGVGSDPVVSAATYVQGLLAGWVSGFGAGGLAIVAAALLVLGFGGRALCPRRRINLHEVDFGDPSDLGAG